MKAFAKTDIGKAREINQDYYYIPTTDKLDLYILADGMGGYNGCLLYTSPSPRD